MPEQPDSRQPPSSATDETPCVVLRPRRGWRVVRVDFEGREISRGRIRLPFDSLRIAEIRNGIFAVSDGNQWICFDTLTYRDDAGQSLMGRDGTLSDGFSRVFYRLQQSLDGLGRVEPKDTDETPVKFDFSYHVRVDYGSIILGIAGLTAFVLFERHMGGNIKGILDMDRAVWFGGCLLLFVAWLFFWRWSSRLRVDAEGIHLQRAFFRRSYPWQTVRAVRQQGLEVEFELQRGRVSLNLDILHGRGSPLLLRRTRRPALTPLGSLFLRWISSRAPEKEEVPVFGTRSEVLVTRVWTFLLVAVNVWMFLKSDPPSVMDGAVGDAEGRAFTMRLEELGARTEASFEEPWRFFTALFLHANVIHIFFNMLILASLAPWLIRIFGLWRGTFLYFGSGFLGNVLAHCLDMVRLSVGASTAVLGIVGALLGGIYRRPYSVPLVARARFRWAIPVVFLLTLGMDSAIVRTDNAAHIGGFLAGFALALVIPPRRVEIS